VKEFTVSKLDAAKRQLETAIRLYFSDGDPVSIHTLTGASYNILRDITKHKGVEPMLFKDRMLDSVKPEYREMFIKKVNGAENFFKHGDRDHEAALDFNADMSELLIIDACAQYKKLAGEEPSLFAIYRVWFTANRPDAFILTDGLSIARTVLKFSRELAEAVVRGDTSLDDFIFCAFARRSRRRCGRATGMPHAATFQRWLAPLSAMFGLVIDRRGSTAPSKILRVQSLRNRRTWIQKRPAGTFFSTVCSHRPHGARDGHTECRCPEARNPRSDDNSPDTNDHGHRRGLFDRERQQPEIGEKG
jgi:hypothetical protein